MIRGYVNHQCKLPLPLNKYYIHSTDSVKQQMLACMIDIFSVALFLIKPESLTFYLTNLSNTNAYTISFTEELTCLYECGNFCLDWYHLAITGLLLVKLVGILVIDKCTVVILPFIC